MHTRKINKNILLGFYLFSLITLCSYASIASEKYSIVAVVGSDIISNLDVVDRTSLIIETSGLTDNAQTRKQLQHKVLQALIDETLQTQDAKRHNIVVTEGEIQGTIANIEKQRGRTSGSLISYLEQKNIGTTSFSNQLKTQIAWNKVVSSIIAPKIQISDEDIAREIEVIKSNSDKQEALISGILFPVKNPKKAEQVKQQAYQTFKTLSAGANFEDVAAKLFEQKQGLTNTQAWVDLKRISPNVASAIANLGERGISLPIKTQAGYQIIKLFERRTTKSTDNSELNFKQILLNLDYDAGEKEVDILMDIAGSVAKHPGTCGEKGIAGLKSFDGLKIEVDYLRTTYATLSSNVQDLVTDLEMGEISKPFATPAGIRLMMLCEKVNKSTVALPKMDDIKQSLFMSKLDLAALKYLRDLRRDAFIEIRQ